MIVLILHSDYTTEIHFIEMQPKLRIYSSLQQEAPNIHTKKKKEIETHTDGQNIQLECKNGIWHLEMCHVGNK